MTEQIAGRGVCDAAVLGAMEEVPRERFVDEPLRERAYDDAPLPIGCGQTISQPFVLARMLELLELAPTDRVLEVGAGSGYAAAVLGQIVHEVYAIERHGALAAQAAERVAALGYSRVHIVEGDGSVGAPARAPFDAILVSAGGPEVPLSLIEQLAIGGRLVMPIGDAMRAQELVRVVRTGFHSYDRKSLGRVHFVPLVGREGWAFDAA